MKQLLLLIGLSVCSTAAFSQQQITNTKKPASTPVPSETSILQEPASDSMAVSSIKKTADPVSPAEPVSNGTNSNKEQKPVLNSTMRKPE